MNDLRLVKLQVATKQHECDECVEPIQPGERYMRVAIPGDASIFPSPEQVNQEDAWRYVDREWTIEKTHELCYGLRYFKPVASLAECGHKRAGKFWCWEPTCDAFINKRSDPNQSAPDIMQLPNGA